jgi:hypothetical protein
MKPQSPTRPKQQTPEEIISDLMQHIRAGFYFDHPQAWFADQHFIKAKVVTWPASWLNSRGVTLKPERYKEVLIGVFETIKVHGNTGSVKYWPGYLLHCLQMHFKCHGDEIYEEAKSLRNKMEAALMACQRSVEASRAADPVAAIAQVNKALMSVGRKKKTVAPAKQQLSLF